MEFILKILVSIFPAFLLLGCTLSPLEQERLAQFPECEVPSARWNSLSSKLTQDESNCIVLKKMKLQNKLDNEKIQNEYRLQKIVEDNNIKEELLERQRYNASSQGVSDRLMCEKILKKSLNNFSYIDFELKDFSRTSDGFVSCVAYVSYKAFVGTGYMTRVIIYNESNGMYKIHDR